MKKIIFAFIISSILAACSEEISLTPGISFLTPEPEVYEETAIFRIIGQSFSSADSLTIPIALGGNAQMGTDYEISADHFVLTKESLTDSIVVYTKQLGTGRTLNLTLEIPEGFVAGKYPSSELRLQDKYGFLTFESSRSFAADTSSYIISVCDSSGMAKAITIETPISFAVNTEKSTAVEGVDFKFVNSSSLNIAPGTSYASFAIVPLGSSPREGKDKIVFSVSSDQKFDTGLIPELEVMIVDPKLKSLNGFWIMNALNTDPLYFEGIWGNECSSYELLPVMDQSDMMEFSFQYATFNPMFLSDIKNFFTGPSDLVFGPDMEIVAPDGDRKNIHLLSLNRTNRYFSEDQISEDSVSYVGVYPYVDADTQTEMMELYILDHTSRSFMPELEAGNRYAAEKPVAATPGMYICATFKKY